MGMMAGGEEFRPQVRQGTRQRAGLKPPCSGLQPLPLT
jgi:hypothetical protein